MCRVFKKKNQSGGFLQAALTTDQTEDEEQHFSQIKLVSYSSPSFAPLLLHDPKQTHHMQHHHLTLHYNYDHHHHHHSNNNNRNNNNMEAYNSMHLPQLFSPETVANPTTTNCYLSPLSNDNTCMDAEAPTRLPSSSDWSFMDKLLASHHGTHNNIDPRFQLLSQSNKLHNHHYLST